MYVHLQQVAFLVTAQADGGGSGGNPLEMLLLPAIMIGILYFFLLRPASVERKKHGKFLETLKRGDEVFTESGITGTVADISEKFITLEIAKNVKVKMIRRVIKGPVGQLENSDGAQKTSESPSKS